MPGAIHAITMPRWGMTMTEGVIGAWLVEVGAPVALGQEILEIETEKIANAYEATSQGTLRRKIAESSTTIEVGALLGLIADETVSEAELDRFATEFNSTRQSHGRAELAQPTARTVRVGSGSLNVLTLGHDGAGQGSTLPVVLMHGFGGDLNSWGLTQSELSATRAVHALDLPAHGGSTIPAEPMTVELLARSASEALDAVGISRAHWVGHSLGAVVSLLIARDRPERVASMTLVCPAGLGREIDCGYITAFLGASRRADMREALATLYAEPEGIQRKLIDDVLRFMRTDGVPGALRALAADAFTDSRQRLVLREFVSSTDLPIQVIWGEQDRVIPHAHALGLPSRVAVHVLASAGHMVHLEQANRVNALIGTFLSRHDATPGSE